MRTVLATQVVQLASSLVRQPSDVGAAEVAPVVPRDTGIRSTCRFDTVPDRSIGAPSMALASPLDSPRLSRRC